MPKPAKTAARDAFMARKAQFDALLAELAQASNDHFFADPDAIDWGHVGSLDHWLARLREVADALYRRGEYAEASR